MFWSEERTNLVAKDKQLLNNQEVRKSFWEGKLENFEFINAMVLLSNFVIVQLCHMEVNWHWLH